MDLVVGRAHDDGADGPAGCAAVLEAAQDVDFGVGQDYPRSGGMEGSAEKFQGNLKSHAISRKSSNTFSNSVCQSRLWLDVRVKANTYFNFSAAPCLPFSLF